MSYSDVLNMAEYGTTAIFKGIKGGQRVYYRDRFGGERSGRANGLLLFPDHVVIDRGQGQPQVVDEGNFVRVGPKPR